MSSQPPAIRIDDIDAAILRELIADGRLPINELARRVNVSRATAYSRLQRLRADEVITGFTATVDPARLGFAATALILVRVEQHDWRVVHDRIRSVPGVALLASTSGEFDLVLLVRLPDIRSLRDVVLVELHGIDGVRSTQTIFVLDELNLPIQPTPT